MLEEEPVVKKFVDILIFLLCVVIGVSVVAAAAVLIFYADMPVLGCWLIVFLLLFFSFLLLGHFLKERRVNYSKPPILRNLVA